MAKRRTNLTITPQLYEQAQQLMGLLHHSDFAGFVEQLIREEWERRHGPQLMQEGKPASDPAAPEKNVSYTKRRKTATG